MSNTVSCCAITRIGCFRSGMGWLWLWEGMWEGGYYSIRYGWNDGVSEMVVDCSKKKIREIDKGCL